MLIDGYSQPGTSANTDPVASNAVLLIELDGSAGGDTGFNIGGGANGSTVQGLVINRFGTGVVVRGGATNCVVRGNFIGTDPTGAVALGNLTGVQIGSDSGTTNTVGGTSPSDRNLVSGNTDGLGAILLESPALVEGNLIGTDATGTHALPNLLGLSTGVGSSIGGTAPGAGNVISGNALDGINVDGASIIYGNRIGTTADGTGPLGNGRYGINATSDTVVGGILAGQGNVIAYNASFGVQVGAFGTGLNNTVRGNSIHDNGSFGINFYPQVVPVPNDAGDADGGSNHFQNFPILQSVTTGASTHIVGKFNSTPSTTFDVDFYADPACSNFPREFLQGETYLGSSQVTTDGSGNAVIDITLPAATEAGARVSATATDPAGNTSEFSQRIIFTMGPASGPAAGGAFLNVLGTDFADPTTMTVGGVATAVIFVDDHTLNSASPALAPGTVNDVVVTTPDGTTGTLLRGWVSDFLDVPGSQQFYAFVTTLVSNAITVGVGGGHYGVDAPTLRQQMAVFIIKAKHGLCYIPPPCRRHLQRRPLLLELRALDRRPSPRASPAAAATARPTAPWIRSSGSRWRSSCSGPSRDRPTRRRCATRRRSRTCPATTRSPRGSTTSSPATSPAVAAAASTVRRSPRPEDRWPSSSRRPSDCNDAVGPLELPARQNVRPAMRSRPRRLLHIAEEQERSS